MVKSNFHGHIFSIKSSVRRRLRQPQQPAPRTRPAPAPPLPPPRRRRRPSPRRGSPFAARILGCCYPRFSNVAPTSPCRSKKRTGHLLSFGGHHRPPSQNKVILFSAYQQEGGERSCVELVISSEFGRRRMTFLPDGHSRGAQHPTTPLGSSVIREVYNYRKYGKMS